MLSCLDAGHFLQLLPLFSRVIFVSVSHTTKANHLVNFVKGPETLVTCKPDNKTMGQFCSIAYLFNCHYFCTFPFVSCSRLTSMGKLGVLRIWHAVTEHLKSVLLLMHLSALGLHTFWESVDHFTIAYEKSKLPPGCNDEPVTVLAFTQGESNGRNRKLATLVLCYVFRRVRGRRRCQPPHNSP